MTIDDDALEAAWDAVFDALPTDRPVGRPSFPRRAQRIGAERLDQREWPSVGVRSRGWTAISGTKLEVLVEMARCLQELGEGRAPT